MCDGYRYRRPSSRIFVLLFFFHFHRIRGGRSCSRVVFVSFDTTSPYFFSRCSTSIERLNGHRYGTVYLYVSVGRIAETLRNFSGNVSAAIYRIVGRYPRLSRPSFSSRILFNLLRLSRVFLAERSSY